VAGPRVVSLLSSATETVFALGLGDLLVGRSHECDAPSAARGLPALSRAKVDPGRPSAAIDRDVRALVEQGLSVYEVDAEALKALAPDVILTQTQCEVCAVSEKDLAAAVASWVGKPPVVVSLKPLDLAGCFADMVRVAEALGAPGKGEELVAGLKERVAAIEAKGRAMPEKPYVATLEWIDPLMTAGNWTPELVEAAGGVDLFGEAGKHSPKLDFAALEEKEPDTLVVMPCGLDLARARAETAALAARPEWKALQAVQDGEVYLTDGNAFFNRPGPRLVESLEILAEVFHPTAFSFGHEGKGWERL